MSLPHQKRLSQQARLKQQVAAVAGALALGLALAGCQTTPRWPATTAPLRFETDTFAFANETVFAYRAGAFVDESALDARRADDRYSRSCFVMARAVVQFWKYARFAPAEPALPAAELQARVTKIARSAPWGRPLPAEDRVVVPGFANLREFSAAEPRLLQARLGSGLATYFRVGNWSMPFVPNRRHQAATRALIDDDLDRGYPAVLWLCNFPRVAINHVVVVYAREPMAGGTRYTVYDPNYTDRPRTLEYDAASRTFAFEPTFYFAGGPVNLRVIYQSVLQ